MPFHLQQLQIEQTALSMESGPLSSLTSHQQVTQLMVGNQMMNLVTAGSGNGHTVNVAPGSRVVVVNGGAAMLEGGRFLMSNGDTADNVGVVLMNSSNQTSDQGSPISIVSGLPLNTINSPCSILSTQMTANVVPNSVAIQPSSSNNVYSSNIPASSVTSSVSTSNGAQLKLLSRMKVSEKKSKNRSIQSSARSKLM